MRRSFSSWSQGEFYAEHSCLMSRDNGPTSWGQGQEWLLTGRNTQKGKSRLTREMTAKARIPEAPSVHDETLQWLREIGGLINSQLQPFEVSGVSKTNTS